MSDNVHLVVTDKDGTQYDITGSLDAAIVTKTAPVVVTPPVVVIPPTAGAPVIPATARRENMLNKAWKNNHDDGTGGTASGATNYPETSPDGRPNCLAARFDTNGGGWIMHCLALTGGADQYNKFCFRKRERKFDPGGWKTINQCETDLEITNPKTGQPYDMALQQSATNNEGLEVSINHKWTPTGVKINPQLRDPNAWHLTENYLTFNPADGSFTVDGVGFNSTFYPIGKTFTDPDASRWGLNELNVQDQYNGPAGKNSHVILFDLFEIVCWFDPTVTNVKKTTA